MRGLGYQFGKLAGTIVVSLNGIRRGIYVGIALAGLLLILFYIAVQIHNQKTPPHLPSAQLQEPNQLKVGRSARVTSNVQMVNIRRTSGYLNKPKDDVIVIVPSGEVVIINGGPEQSDNLLWWYIRWGAYDGWMAERRSSGQLLLEPH